MYNVTGGGTVSFYSGIYSITKGYIYSISLECTMLQGGIYNVMVLWGCTLQVAVSCYIGKYSITVERTILISFEK